MINVSRISNEIEQTEFVAFSQLNFTQFAKIHEIAPLFQVK